MTFLKATITDIQTPIEDVRCLSLKPAENFRFQAGQYIRIYHEEFAPRSYSIASAPHKNGEFELHVKATTDGLVSRYLLESVTEGETITFDGPFGDNIFHPEQEGPMLCVAGGVGIVPLKAIIEAALDKDPLRHIILLWGANHEKELYLGSFFKTLEEQHEHFEYKTVTEQPVTNMIENTVAGTEFGKIHLCGPWGMVEKAHTQMLEMGLDAKNISFDRPAEIKKTGA